MNENLRFDRAALPRAMRRLFDGRGDPRDAGDAVAGLQWRGKIIPVKIINQSRSGAMLSCSETPQVGEVVALDLAERAPSAAVVRWVRDGRIGIHFAMPLR